MQKEHVKLAGTVRPRTPDQSIGARSVTLTAYHQAWDAIMRRALAEAGLDPDDHETAARRCHRVSHVEAGPIAAFHDEFDDREVIVEELMLDGRAVARVTRRGNRYFFAIQKGAPDSKVSRKASCDQH